jgi:preprotein translocase subunit SecF
MRTPNVDFTGKAPRWAMISAALLVLSFAGFLVRGLDLSIEFVGGTSFTLSEVAPDTSSGDLRDAAEAAGATDVIAQMQTDGDVATGAVVRTEAIEPGSSEERTVREALLEAGQTDADQLSTDFVGPAWGERITRQAVEALLVFLVVVTIYISLRLEFKMAIAALVALAHDLVITVGLYALIGFTVSPATVIAILTILGYSLYDTVVVFDRVKENSISLGDPGRRYYAELVNGSLNEVVWRSINTSVTSLLPVGALLFVGAQLLGATTLQDLALALFIGMGVGIFSSLFVAGPFFSWWRMRDPDQQRLKAKADARDAGQPLDDDEEAPVPSAPEPDVVPGSPEARAPITTEYVRGEGKRKKRRKR